MIPIRRNPYTVTSRENLTHCVVEKTPDGQYQVTIVLKAKVIEIDQSVVLTGVDAERAMYFAGIPKPLLDSLSVVGEHPLTFPIPE